MRKLKKTWRIFRSAITGRFVSKEYAEQHLDETVSERVDASETVARSEARAQL